MFVAINGYAKTLRIRVPSLVFLAAPTMQFRRVLIAVLLTMALAGLVRADYLFEGWFDVARYTDSGKRRPGFTIAYPDYPNEDVGYFEEALYGVSLGSNGLVYAIGNSLGTFTVQEFDPNTGLGGKPRGVLQSSVFKGHYSDSLAAGGLEDCGFREDYCFADVIRTGRFNRTIHSSSDGFLYSSGPVDSWAIDILGGVRVEWLETAWGIHRYDIEQGGPPQLVMPLTLDGNGYLPHLVEWEINESNNIELTTEHGVVEYTVPSPPIPGSFEDIYPQELWSALELKERFLVAESLSDDPSNDLQVLTLKQDLEELGDDPFGWFSSDAPGLRPHDPPEDPFDPGDLPELEDGFQIWDEFQDDSGNTLLLLSRIPADLRVPGVYEQKLLEFDTQTALLKRVVFEHAVDDYLYLLYGGFYVRTVPEPSTSILLMLILTGFGLKRCFTVPTEMTR